MILTLLGWGKWFKRLRSVRVNLTMRTSSRERPSIHKRGSSMHSSIDWLSWPDLKSSPGHLNCMRGSIRNVGLRALSYLVDKSKELLSPERWSRTPRFLFSMRLPVHWMKKVRRLCSKHLTEQWKGVPPLLLLTDWAPFATAIGSLSFTKARSLNRAPTKTFQLTLTLTFTN